MKFWQVLNLVDMQELPALAKHAEELGFEGVTVGDHLITFETQYQAYDYSKDSQILWYPRTHWADPWVQFAALSQVTTKLKFSTNVYVLPMHDVFSVAKAVSTAAFVSNNRVELGLGVGWQKDEFDLVGADFHTRGRRTDEMLDILPQLMSGEMVEYHGEFHDFPRLQMSPGVPRVPITVGGVSEVALKRAARHDGWIGPFVELDAVPPFIKTLRDERARLGKSGEPFEISVSLYEDSAAAHAKAQEMGVTRLLRGTWLGEDGRVAHNVPVETKLRDMDAFAEKFMR